MSKPPERSAVLARAGGPPRPVVRALAAGTVLAIAGATAAGVLLDPTVVPVGETGAGVASFVAWIVVGLAAAAGLVVGLAAWMAAVERRRPREVLLARFSSFQRRWAWLIPVLYYFVPASLESAGYWPLRALVPAPDGSAAVEVVLPAHAAVQHIAGILVAWLLFVALTLADPTPGVPPSPEPESRPSRPARSRRSRHPRR